jgi:hypothetical protein
MVKHDVGRWVVVRAASFIEIFYEKKGKISRGKMWRERDLANCSSLHRRRSIEKLGGKESNTRRDLWLQIGEFFLLSGVLDDDNMREPILYTPTFTFFYFYPLPFSNFLFFATSGGPPFPLRFTCPFAGRFDLWKEKGKDDYTVLGRGGDIIIMGISFHCESLDSFLSITAESIR